MPTRLLSLLLLTSLSSASACSDDPTTQAPTVAFVSPGDGAQIFGSVELRADVTNAVQVEFDLDGASIGTASTAPWVLRWETTQAADGPHTLGVVARSASGAEAMASIAVVVDNTPPTVTFLSPESGAIISGPIEVQVEASDAVGVASLAVMAGETTLEETAPGKYAWAPGEEAGEVTLRAVAVDAIGHTANAEVRVVVRQMLTVAVTNCTAGQCVPLETGEAVAGRVTLEASIDGGGEVVDVVLEVDGDQVGSFGGTPWRVQWNTAALSAGDHDVRVLATDEFGGIGSVTIRVQTEPCDGDSDGYDARRPGCYGTDCDDSDDAVHPGAEDNPGDSVDSDCDGEDGVAAGPTIECGDLAGPLNSCAAAPGDGSLLLRGDILAGDLVYHGGEVLISANGVIQCAGCSCEGRPDREAATIVTCADSVISPGFINPHDHLGWTQNSPGRWGEERYEHRHDWRRGLRGHREINARGGASDSQVAWGELRQLMAGTTSIAGAGGVPGFLRNLDRNGLDEGLGASVDLETFPLGDSGGELLSAGCAYPRLPDAYVTEIPSWVPHVSEGIDAEARNEFLCLSDPNRGIDVATANAAFVHGIALTADDGQELAVSNTALIWSPRSNISLYGHTAPVPMLVTQGVLVSIGTDWTPSGSAHMGRELACAYRLDQDHYGGVLGTKAIWQMATRNAAGALHVDDRVGTIRRGLVADIVVLSRAGADDPYLATIDASAEDVRLVLRGGVPMYGDAAVFDAIESWQNGCESMGDVCGAPRWVCASRELGMSFGALEQENQRSYDLFFCGDPDGEPSCVPFRQGEFDGTSTENDLDGDGIPNGDDNCPAVFNAPRPVDGQTQPDLDGDSAGDACDPCPANAEDVCSPPNPADADGDGVGLGADNCPTVPNPEQLDSDDDGKGDACDPCPDFRNLGGEGCPVTIPDIKRGIVAEGESVIIEGVVTATARRRLFVQVPEAQWGGEGAAFTGIHVYIPSANPAGLPSVAEGDHVRIHGVANLYYGQRQVSGVRGLEVLGQEVIPTPQPVYPHDVATGGDLAMAFESVLIVTAGEVTEVNPPAGPGDDDPTGEYVLDQALRVGDYIFGEFPLPEIGTERRVTGVLRFANGDSKVEPRSADDVEDVVLPPRLRAFGPESVLVEVSEESAQTTPALEITLTKPAPQGGLTVTLTSGAPLNLEALDVFLPEGEDRAPVPVSATLAREEPIQLSAQLGDRTLVASVRVLDPERQALPTVFTPESLQIRLGRTGLATLHLDLPAQADGVTVSLRADPGTVVAVPETVFVPGFAQSVEFAVQSLEEGTATVIASVGDAEITLPILVIPSLGLGVVLSEVLYDTSGADDGKEWIEIFNAGPADVDLSTYSLGSGGTDYTNSRVQLDGILPPGACIVIGGPESSDDNGNPTFDLERRFSPNLQNSGATADGVALFDVRSSDIDGDTIPIDAVIYGGANENGLVDAEGNTPEPHVGDVSGGQSIERTLDGWRQQPDPTPNDCSTFE
jgi:cytosine/adenosine deaminase-related metal-dependent hydrolase